MSRTLLILFTILVLPLAVRTAEAEPSQGLEACTGFDQALPRLECFDAAYERAQVLGQPLSAELKACSDRKTPLDRLDCFDSVFAGEGLTDEHKAPRYVEDAAAGTARTARCYAVPDEDDGKDLAEKMERILIQLLAEVRNAEVILVVPPDEVGARAVCAYSEE